MLPPATLRSAESILAPLHVTERPVARNGLETWTGAQYRVAIGYHSPGPRLGHNHSGGT
jgi:hypothetical protein